MLITSIFLLTTAFTTYYDILLVSYILAVHRKLCLAFFTHIARLANYSETTSINNFEIIPEDILPDATSQFENVSGAVRSM